MSVKEENKIKEEKSIFTKEDEALLNDLDLDF